MQRKKNFIPKSIAKNRNEDIISLFLTLDIASLNDQIPDEKNFARIELFRDKVEFKFTTKQLLKIRVLRKNFPFKKNLYFFFLLKE